MICHNPEAAARDAAVRERLIEHLQGLIEGSDAWPDRNRDELVGSLKRQARAAQAAAAHQVRAAAHRPRRRAREAHYDGKWLLRTSDLTLTAEDLAAAYKQLLAVERGWRDCKSASGCARSTTTARIVSAPTSNCVGWHCCSSGSPKPRTGDTWRNLRHELDRMHLVTLATGDGRVAQRSALTSDQKTILAALDLPEPPKYLDFTPDTDPAAKTDGTPGSPASCSNTTQIGTFHVCPDQRPNSAIRVPTICGSPARGTASHRCGARAAVSDRVGAASRRDRPSHGHYHSTRHVDAPPVFDIQTNFASQQRAAARRRQERSARHGVPPLRAEQPTARVPSCRTRYEDVAKGPASAGPPELGCLEFNVRGYF